MISNLDELKNLILWAKDQRVKRLSVAGVEVEFSELAFVGEYPDLSDKIDTTADEQTELGASPEEAADDDLLYHST